QKQFPVPVTFDSLLTDDERRAAEAKEFVMAADSWRKLAERQYLSYIAFTRPGQYLYISYPGGDSSSSARSQFVTAIMSLFEGLSEQFAGDEVGSLDNIYGKGELEGLLCSKLGRDDGHEADEELYTLLNTMKADSDLGKAAESVTNAISYENEAKLDKGVVSKLFAGDLHSSATRLGIFSACPYQYFAKYTLGLEERDEFKFEPLDMGNFYHLVLDAMVKKCESEKIDMTELVDDEITKMVDELCEKILTESSFLSNFRTHSLHNAFIIESARMKLINCVHAMVEMLKAGTFRPRRSEVKFGWDDGLGEFKLAIDKKRNVYLRGKIDRLDIAEIDGETAAVVFDYKRSGKKFNWGDLYHGLDMQLLVYTLAVKLSPKARDIIVVGGFFVPIEASPVMSLPGELEKKSQGFTHKAKGFFNGDYAGLLDSGLESGWSRYYNLACTKKDGTYGYYGTSGAIKALDFDNVLSFAKEKIIEIAKRIVTGDINVRPYQLNGKSPCPNCVYKPVCRFDWQINDYNFLTLKRKGDLLNELGAADEVD
ncbi:MAG: PD-(D/E)XK nuclease family protein, partial [Phycisphaerae bacterium]|nr:PD-(D/E)XK nuclease family protein [Phycisphaerae bacterium]